MSLFDLLWQLPVAVVLLAIGGWGAMAFWYRGPVAIKLRVALMTSWLVVALTAVIALFTWHDTDFALVSLAVFALAWAALLTWWASIRPQQCRNWAADVARLLDIERDGDRVRLHNVRNFEWCTREDFMPRWETRDYDVSQIVASDLVVSYWMGPAIAHTLVSFAFAAGAHLVFSVEVRRLAGMEFSPYGGFFKQSELVIVAADERDIVRTRSNMRGEDVYLYRVALPPVEARRLFHAYLDEAAKLHDAPRFYHTLFTNCTTIVYDMIRRIVPGLPWDYRLLASGYLPNYLYDLGALDTTQPFAELKERSHINARAIASDIDGRASGNFSHDIRVDLPYPRGYTEPPP